MGALTAPYLEMWRTKSDASLKSGSGTMASTSLSLFLEKFVRFVSDKGSNYHPRRQPESQVFLVRLGRPVYTGSFREDSQRCQAPTTHYNYDDAAVIFRICWGQHRVLRRGLAASPRNRA